MPPLTPQAILEAIAALPEAERGELLSRLREIYGRRLPAPGEPERQADYMIVFDGGSHGNPGRAYGSYILFNDKGSGQVERLAFEAELTNNQAEYQTLLCALRDLTQRLGRQAGEAVLVVRGDSQLVIEQLSGRWQVRDETLRALWDEARELLGAFKRHRLVWQSREETLQMLGH